MPQSRPLAIAHSVSSAAGRGTCNASLFCSSVRYFSHRLQLLLHAPPNCLFALCNIALLGPTSTNSKLHSTDTPSRHIVMFPVHALETEHSAVPNLANKPLNLHPFALAASQSRRSQVLLAPGSFGLTIVKAIPLTWRGEYRRFHLLRAAWAMKD